MPDIKLTMRLPVDIHERIAQLAEQNKTSLNGQIVTMLRDWFDGDDKFSALEARIAALEQRLAA